MIWYASTETGTIPRCKNDGQVQLFRTRKQRAHAQKLEWPALGLWENDWGEGWIILWTASYVAYWAPSRLGFEPTHHGYPSFGHLLSFSSRKERSFRQYALYVHEIKLSGRLNEACDVM